MNMTRGIVLFAAFLSSIAHARHKQMDAAKFRNAKQLSVQDVATPVKGVIPGVTMYAPNPDGKTWDILQVYFARYGGPNEIVIIDTGSGEVKSVKQPRYMQWHLCSRVFANGKLYINVLTQPHLKQEVNVYDPATNTLKMKAIRMPQRLSGETHPMVLGSDGKIYAAGRYGTSGRVSACQIDPVTHQVTDYGSMGPSHSDGCWGYTAGADDRYVYVASGKIPWYLVCYDKHTGKQSVLITHLVSKGYLYVRRHNGYLEAGTWEGNPPGNRKYYWLHNGKAIPKGNGQPQGMKRVVNSLLPMPEVFTKNREPGADGKCTIWVRYAKDRKPSQGENCKPEDEGWKAYRYKVDTRNKTIFRLRELPNGKIFGVGDSYGAQFIYDPATNRADASGRVHISYYAHCTMNGKLYMGGYPTSVTYEYDPTRRWTEKYGSWLPNKPVASNKSRECNPRFLGNLNRFSGVHKIRGMAAGADGCIYLGGEWMRDGSGGGLAWYDPKTGKEGGFRNGLQQYSCRYMTAAGRGRYIVISTNSRSSAKVFVFDTQIKKIIHSFVPVNGAKGTGPVAGVDGDFVMGITNNGSARSTAYIYRFNAATGKMDYVHEYRTGTALNLFDNQTNGFDFRRGPDGKVYTFLEGATLVRISPKTGAIEPVGSVRGGAGYIAFSGRDIYLSGQAELRRIAGVVGR